MLADVTTTLGAKKSHSLTMRRETLAVFDWKASNKVTISIDQCEVMCFRSAILLLDYYLSNQSQSIQCQISTSEKLLGPCELRPHNPLLLQSDRFGTQL